MTEGTSRGTIMLNDIAHIVHNQLVQQGFATNEASQVSVKTIESIGRKYGGEGVYIPKGWTLAAAIRRVHDSLARLPEAEKVSAEETTGAIMETGNESAEMIKERIRKVMGLSRQEVAANEAQYAKTSAALEPLTPEEIQACWEIGVEPFEYFGKREEVAGVSWGQQEIDTASQRALCSQMGIDPEGLGFRPSQEIKDTAAQQVLTPEEYDICKKMGVDPLDLIIEKSRSNEALNP